MSSNKKILLSIKDLRELGVIKKKKTYKKRVNKKTNKTLLFNNSIPNNKNLPTYFQTTTLYNEQQQLTNKLLENKLVNGGNNRLLLNNGYNIEDNMGANTSLNNRPIMHISEKYKDKLFEPIPDGKTRSIVDKPSNYKTSRQYDAEIVDENNNKLDIDTEQMLSNNSKKNRKQNKK